jgi:hypothetical protein
VAVTWIPTQYRCRSKAKRSGVARPGSLDPVDARRRRASANYGCTTTLFRTRCGFNSAGHVRINTVMINDRRSIDRTQPFFRKDIPPSWKRRTCVSRWRFELHKETEKRPKLGGSEKSGGFVGGEIRACPRPPSRARGTAVCLSSGCLMSWNHEASEPTSMYFRALLWRAGSVPACACSRC